MLNGVFIMKSIKISVIIPVYNVEKYIKQCLDSIVNQTLEDIEIICIDDGSTDNSPYILEKYAIKDDRIIVITNDHKGAGAARNSGLRIAKGNYISFVDSDDWIGISAYEKLYNAAISKDADMVFFKMLNYSNEHAEFYNTDYYDLTCIKKFFTNLTYNYHDFRNQLFRIAVSPCNKIYKRSFLERINAKFPEGLIFEDNPFFYNNILNAEKVLLYDKYLYFRRRIKNSVMSSLNSKHFDIISISNEIINVFKNNNLFEEFKKNLFNRKIILIKNTVYGRLDEKYKSDFFKCLKEDFSIIKKNKDLNRHYEDNLTPENLYFYLNSTKTDNSKEFDLLNENSHLELEIIKIKHDFKEKNKKLHEKNKKLYEKNKKLYGRNKRLKSELNEIYSSNSWKITEPIRKIGEKIR